MRVLSHVSHVELFVTLWTVPLQAPCPGDSPGKNTGVGCHFLLQGDLPNPGSEPVSLMSPALAGKFFTASATWEAQVFSEYWRNHVNKNKIKEPYTDHHKKE